MDTIGLFLRGELRAEYRVGPQGLVFGRSSASDVVLLDPSLPQRAFALRRRDHRLWLVDVTSGDEDELREGQRLPLGSQYAVEWLEDAAPRVSESIVRTEPIALRDDEDGDDLSLAVGRGPDARRVRMTRGPMLVGTDVGCDVVLMDRAVSARHCSLERTDLGWIVRDLGSRNGTYVEGVRSFAALLRSGSRLRVGRTDLTLIRRSAAGRGALIARSAQMIDVMEQVARLAPLSLRVLVQGETGAGKEGVARALHTQSSRSHGPFVDVNASTFPKDLVESELFGHEKGAFTGAQATRKGVFEQAHGGTLFLDEVGELPLAMQARLLRVLETKEVRRVGAESSVSVDVRLVCATHRDLRRMVEEGDFRQDLYYRLAESTIVVPPLRERAEDILALAEHAVGLARVELGTRVLTEGAKNRLLLHDWPGNVRELFNVVRGAAARSAGTIDVCDIEEALGAGTTRPRSARQLSVAEMVERYGEANLTKLSELTGIPRTTLRDRHRAEQRRRSLNDAED
jgi:transcriptional regulator with GAF, ATPase, and Fis domain